MNFSCKQILSGNEAIAFGAYDFGVKVAAAYPGTPSTEILENIVLFDDIYAEWSPNEKIAFEVAFGACLGGVRSLVSMKHVGLNVAADPLFTASYTGVNGGLVVISADDPGIHSSQNEQDNRHYALAAKIPMLEPADSEEAYVYMGRALEISEQYDTPVLLRLTTRVAHSKSIVRRREQRNENLNAAGFVKDRSKYVMLPAFARDRHVYVEHRMDRLRELSESIPINYIEWNQREIGLITSGVAYQYAREVRPQASFLKLGLTNPIPARMIKAFAAGIEKIFVVEELDPYLEQQVKALGIPACGKECFPLCGELSPEIVEQGLGGRKERKIFPAFEIPARPPPLCPGCPHLATLYTVKTLGLSVMGDIGCYTLSAAPPLETMDAVLCMGASIAMAHGLEKALGPKAALKNGYIAVLGDSTFLHAGLASLMNVAYNKGTSTVLVLDNRTTAMTGFQDHAATGVTIHGEGTCKIDLEALGKALGIAAVHTVDPYDMNKLKTIIKEEMTTDHASLIIVRRACLHLPDTETKPPKQIDPGRCNGCLLCLQCGCPALNQTAAGKVHIDDIMCCGCPICTHICKFGAISEFSYDEESAL